MSPFSVTLPQVADQELGPLLIHLAEAGYHNGDQAGLSTRAGRAPGRTRHCDLRGTGVLEKEGEAYQWPGVRDRFSSRVSLGLAPSAVRFGRDDQKRKWGRDRVRRQFLSSGSPHRPLPSSSPTTTPDSSSSPSFAGATAAAECTAGDTLPQVYQDHFRTQIYSERVVHPGAWNKVVVVAREGDDRTMLNHALVQGRRRYAAR